MVKSLAVATVTGAILLGAPAISWAGWDEYWGQHHGRAPEPVTIIGLTLGVAGIVGGRLAWGRKSNRKRD
jgi:uncharacterized membrane protein YphA (DoxX/SURF4 family)